MSVTGQVTVRVREVGRHRKIDGIKGDLLALIPRIEVMKDKADRRFDPSHLTHGRVALQHTDIGASASIKSKGRAYLAHAIQVEGQREYRKQYVVPRDGKVVDHCRIRRLKAFRSLHHTVRTDHVIGHDFATNRA